MKFSIVFLSLTLAAVLQAQDKVTVPLSSPGQPVTLKVSMTSGSITVNAGTGNELTVQTSSTSSRRGDRDNAPAGMRRIGGGTSDVDVEEDHNVVPLPAARFGTAPHIVIT